jgi:hypothetical protein
MITHKSIGYSGRLGNQMFQYAALKVISTAMKKSIILPDNTNIKKNGCFDFTNNIWIPYKLDLLEGFDLNCTIGNIEGDNVVIDGYFQTYEYISGYEEEIMKEFKFKPHILTKCNQIINLYKNPVSIHVRRQDYINHPDYWVITPEYIQKALNYFNDSDYTFLIFSDDIDWCKQVFPDGVVFIQGNQFEDMCLMSLCDHNVICNSTFSWWGAFLNKNINKKVIAPAKWFSEDRNLSYLYPQNWLVI